MRIYREYIILYYIIIIIIIITNININIIIILLDYILFSVYSCS